MLVIVWVTFQINFLNYHGNRKSKDLDHHYRKKNIQYLINVHVASLICLSISSCQLQNFYSGNIPMESKNLHLVKLLHPKSYAMSNLYELCMLIIKQKNKREENFIIFFLLKYYLLEYFFSLFFFQYIFLVLIIFFNINLIRNYAL